VLTKGSRGTVSTGKYAIAIRKGNEHQLSGLLNSLSQFAGQLYLQLGTFVEMIDDSLLAHDGQIINAAMNTTSIDSLYLTILLSELPINDSAHPV
jgi:hypothetical protein